jgi:2-oxoisovalerate dehydrogenase E2 component (dihydrolipoyl transacylase)
MTRFLFRLPDIGEGIAEAEIVAWHVAVGDRVEEDQPLADMMTDKATVEMESPVSGTIVALAGEPGDQIAIGSTLVTIETDAEATEPSPPPPPPQGEDIAKPEVAPAAPPPEPPQAEPVAPRARVLATPAVRARAEALGIDLAQVQGTSDRLRHADLDAYLLYHRREGYQPPGQGPTRPDEAIRVIGLRRRIAENMAASKRHIPHFSYVDELDVTALEAMRGELNAQRRDRPKLTLLPFLIVALCKALPEFPMLNARYDDEAGIVTRYGAVHLGIATQTDQGLMVPVLRDAQDYNLWQLAREIGRLSQAARSGAAKPQELSGSTLTLTSLGPLGGIATTPVINRPEVAIVGPNRIIERPVFKNGAVVAAKLMNLSISCDHRVVDGWDAASFVQAVKRLIETPVLLFAPD